MSQQLELMANCLDLRYGRPARFIAWLVPTLGFIGTVYSLGERRFLRRAIYARRSTCTRWLRLWGLVLTAPWWRSWKTPFWYLVVHLVQEREESALNGAGDQTLWELNGLASTGCAGRRQGKGMRARSREINIFNMSLLDIWCGALGAFCFMMPCSCRIYKPPGKETDLHKQQG